MDYNPVKHLSSMCIVTPSTLVPKYRTVQGFQMILHLTRSDTIMMVFTTIQCRERPENSQFFVWRNLILRIWFHFATLYQWVRYNLKYVLRQNWLNVQAHFPQKYIGLNYTNDGHLTKYFVLNGTCLKKKSENAALNCIT